MAGPSHHPLVAGLSERQRLLWATLRAGHAGTANGAREFLAQALPRLPPGHRLGLVRADAGFCVTAFLEALEAGDLPYIRRAGSSACGQTLAERPDARGRRLIECPGYTYRVFVTTVPYVAELVTRMYAGRADSENRIKELKEDLSLDTFCLQSCDATDAAFRTGCVLYNLLMGFRETVLPSCWLSGGYGRSAIWWSWSGRT